MPRILCTTDSVSTQGLCPLGRGDAHAYGSCEQDVKAFLREMMVVAQNVCQALAAHRLHGDTVGQAVLLIETSFVQGQRIEERGMTLGNHGDVRIVEHIPDCPRRFFPDMGPGRTAKGEVFGQHLLDGIETVRGQRLAERPHTPVPLVLPIRQRDEIECIDEVPVHGYRFGNP